MPNWGTVDAGMFSSPWHEIEPAIDEHDLQTITSHEMLYETPHILQHMKV